MNLAHIPPGGRVEEGEEGRGVEKRRGGKRGERREFGRGKRERY